MRPRGGEISEIPQRDFFIRMGLSVVPKAVNLICEPPFSLAYAKRIKEAALNETH